MQYKKILQVVNFLDKVQLKEFTSEQVLKLVKLSKEVKEIVSEYYDSLAKIMESHDIKPKENGMYEVPKELDKKITDTVNSLLDSEVELKNINFIEEEKLIPILVASDFKVSELELMVELFIK